MKRQAFLLFAIFTFILTSNVNAGRIEIEHITFDLEKEYQRQLEFGVEK